MSTGLPSNDRRNFIKKTMALSVAASQPIFLTGLIRASGGGGGSYSKSTDTTDPYTSFPDSTDGSTFTDTTVPE